MSLESLKDFKPGPLEFYRKKASFNWKKLKTVLDTPELVNYKDEIVEALEKFPEFERNFYTETLDEKRRICARQNHIVKTLPLLSTENLLPNMKKFALCNSLLTLISPDALIKYTASVQLFVNAIISLGTKRHRHFIEESNDGKIHGAFCLTEVGHGTNTKRLETTATYDVETKEFIIDSPTFTAAKCWSGGLGQTASVVVVMAQLIVNGERKGIHGFVAPIRDPKTLIPYPGVIVGDLGEKIGLNGVDNGFIIWQNYRIPRENLLNKTGDVTEDGRYITPFRDSNKRHGASLGYLSIGRVNITNVAAGYGIKALTIAVRYAAVRKQFGPNNDAEMPILEYQTHQYRLLPHLSAGYALRIFGDFLMVSCYNFTFDSMLDPKNDQLAERGIEIHAISSASKPLSSWAMRDAIQECREACGGHGYLKASGLGDLRNNNDANCTYEGDNTVLLQQTSNWLLKFWPSILKRSKISTPLKSADFLTNAELILKNTLRATDVNQFCSSSNMIDTYQWLVSYLLRESYENLKNTLRNGSDPFWANSNNQVFLAKDLSIAYIQHFILQQMLVTINEAGDENVRNVLQRLFSLYAVWSLKEHHLTTLYRGGFFNGYSPSKLIQDAILKLCTELKDDAVALIDAIAPPDFAIASVLGYSDGEIYKRLESIVMHSPYGMGRPTWWQELVENDGCISKSKL